MVGLGGFLGSICRYGIAMGTTKILSMKFYTGTLTVNLLGSFLIGILVAYFSKNQSQFSTFLIAGFCGGFTTFSTFSLDGLKLLRQNMYLEFLSYASISMIGGLLLCFLGFYFFNKA